MLEQRSMASESLGREIVLRIHTPTQGAPCRRFPVLYMYDGDVVFREGPAGFDFASYYQDYCDYLPQVIIVGIEPPKDRRRRTAEFSPYTKAFETHGADFEPLVVGRGELLLDFVIQELMPWVNETYPTLSDRNHTAIGGMSSGALNATYAILRHGDVFSRALLHSPAYNLWLPELLRTAQGAGLKELLYCYMDIGTEDATRMSAKEQTMRSALRMREELLLRGLDESRFRFFIIPGGKHTPATWRWTFPDALRWIFRDIGPAPGSNLS